MSTICFISSNNFSFGVFSDWDTLHPEFNFGVGFEREISGVFRSEQGLEAVAEDVFLLSPQLPGGSGFSISINSLNIVNIQTVNDLKSIEITPFPYRYLSQISTATPQQKSGNVFVLTKSYETGWKAYELKNVNRLDTVFPFLFGTELKEHVLVDNWENGWILNSGSNNSEIVTIFWPQYLEYLGFGILMVVIVWLAVSVKKKSKRQALSP